MKKKDDKTVEELIEIAKTGKEEQERKAPSVLDDFLLVFQFSRSDTEETPFWAIYRAYRNWQPNYKLLTKKEFITEFNKQDFDLCKSFTRASNLRRYKVSSLVDQSDAAYYAEKRYEADLRAEKERQRKEKYKDKPYVKWRAQYYKLHPEKKK